MSQPIHIFDHELKIGDEVRAFHYMNNADRWSEDKRNYVITSLAPLMGRELWEGGGGEPRRDWRLSRKEMELVRPRKESG